MEHIASGILKHRKVVLASFIVVSLICLLLMRLVKINYNLSDYLPETAPSTQAMRMMEESFNEDIPNTSVYMPNLTIPKALAIKSQIAAVAGVENVLWLDDVTDVQEPLETKDKATVEAWYKDGGALFSVTVDNATVEDSIASIRSIIGEDGAMSGDSVNRAEAQTSVGKEIPRIMLLVVPLTLLILLISTSSWFEPVLFLVAIGVAIVINLGTNIFQGEISFITQSTSAVLQLAVSMDYAVFLLHSFARFRHQGMELKQAMIKAMAQSFSAIAASATTTVFGFLALALMRFKVGPDMGFVLAKGVGISFLCVVVLLPVLALAAAKIMDKTHHKPLLPSFNKFARGVLRICIPLSAVVMILIVPAFLAQKNNDFIYGSSGMHSEGSTIQENTERINELFGESQQMVLLVPEGDAVNETKLSNSLKKIDSVKTVISYADTVGVQIPSAFIPGEEDATFHSAGFSRTILSVSTKDEGEKAFQAVEDVRAAAGEYYGEYYLLGQSVINYDLKDTITGDNLTVTLAAVIAIGIVLMITFRSASIPLILLLAIEGATWINLGIPYFTGDSMNYIGYQIISSVQLGATVDYGILFTQHYMSNRRTMAKKEAAQTAISTTAPSILTPASILVIAGIALGIVSSNGIISQLGTILGRGAAISAVIVLTVLPALLMALDTPIQKTTLKASFINKELKK